MTAKRRYSAKARAPEQGVAPGFVSGLLAGPVALGKNPAHWLTKCGSTIEQYQRGVTRLSLKNYAQLYNLIAEDLDDEAFGLFSTPLRCGTFEFLTRSVINSATLGDALDRASRYLRLMLPDMAVVIKRDGARCCLELHDTPGHFLTANDPRRIFAFEWLLRLIHALSCWLIDRNISLEEVRFPYEEPAHAGDYELIYTAQSHFRAPHLKAVFDIAYLHFPVRREEADLADFLDGAPGRISMLYRRDREMVRRVRDVIAESLRTPLSLNTIASRLKISTRSLQRQLALEHSSLRKIKDAVRRDRAFAKLRRTNEPISQIADELGYSDATAFYRAFYNWTEQSPKEFREAASGQK